MKTVLTFMAVISIVVPLSAYGPATTMSIASGNWSASGTWNNGVPAANVNVVINGYTVTVDADGSCYGLTINSGGTLSFGGTNTLHVGGNFLNNGTFTYGSGLVEFNGTSLQTIDGTADGFGYVAYFNDITINNTAGVQMLNNISIQSSLVLSTGQFDINAKILQLQNTLTLTRVGGTLVKSGGAITSGGYISVVYTAPCTTGDEFVTNIMTNLTIDVGVGNSVTMASSATAFVGMTLTSGNLVTGANTITVGYSGGGGTLNYTSGSVVGNFKEWFTNSTVSNVVLPVGTASKYRPVAISFTSAPSAAGTITASFITSDPGTNGVNLSTSPISDGGTYSINKVATDGYWTLSPGDGLIDGTYSIDITANGFAGVSDYTNLRVVKRANGTSNWEVEGTHADGTGSNTTPVAHRTGLLTSGLSPSSDFGIGSNTADNPLPVQLTSFTALVAGKNVKLQWQTATETNSYGFDIERKVASSQSSAINSSAGNWSNVGFVEAKGTTSAPTSYSFSDAVTAAGTYLYRLKQISHDGSFEYSKETEATVLFTPTMYQLGQNYPNPFNPSTTINYQLSKASNVSLKIFNTLGQLVASLVDEYKEAGYYQARWDASSVSSGIYFYRLEAGKFVEMKKMLLVK